MLGIITTIIKKKFEYLYANRARYGTAFLLRFHIWPALKIYFNC